VVPEVPISNHFPGVVHPGGPRLATTKRAAKGQKKTRRFSLLKKDRENPGN